VENKIAPESIKKTKELKLLSTDFQELSAEQQESLSKIDTIKANRKLRRLMKRLSKNSNDDKVAPL
jgi:hypothetical protein